MTQLEILFDAVDRYYRGKDGSLGFSKISAIVENKINELIDQKETNWQRFVSFCSDSFSGYQPFDLAYQQFPSLQLRISLNEKEYDFGKSSESLFANLSLLCPFYTYFVQQEYFFPIYSESNPIAFRIVHAKTCTSDFHKLLFSKIETGLLLEFENYQYINHELLFRREVDQIIPWPDQTIPGSYTSSSLYRLLFDGFYPQKNVEVVP